MIVYAESSAVLAWILSEPEGATVRKQLATAERVVSSTLTAVECHRAVARGVAARRLSQPQSLAALRLLGAAADTWTTVEMTGSVLHRARRAFPHEPVRTLDAIHLETAWHFRQAFPRIVVVSLDERIRANAWGLEIEVS